jgi:CheY-like chemotaxis protein
LGRARILLADDHPDLLKMVERHSEPEFKVVGKVVDGQALLEEATRLKPDVIVSDISMPLLNGIEAADQLNESGCQPRFTPTLISCAHALPRALWGTLRSLG